MLMLTINRESALEEDVMAEFAIIHEYTGWNHNQNFRYTTLTIMQKRYFLGKFFCRNGLECKERKRAH